jgi:hypothetical protein
MDKDDKRKLFIEVSVSTFVILLMGLLITICNSCYPQIIDIKGLENKSLILRTIIQTIGLFLGFIITSVVMKFNQLDGLIQKLAEDLNSFLKNNYFRNYRLNQSELDRVFNEYLRTNPIDKKEKQQILFYYNKLYSYRDLHKQWFRYPLIYSSITMLLAFILLIFEKTIKSQENLYVFLFSICCFMSIWVIYINITFILEFLDNPFKRK